MNGIAGFFGGGGKKDDSDMAMPEKTDMALGADDYTSGHGSNFGAAPGAGGQVSGPRRLCVRLDRRTRGVASVPSRPQPFHRELVRRARAIHSRTIREMTYTRSSGEPTRASTSVRDPPQPFASVDSGHPSSSNRR